MLADKIQNERLIKVMNLPLLKSNNRLIVLKNCAHVVISRLKRPKIKKLY